MKRMTVTLTILLLLVYTFGEALGETEEFSLRGGIKFGMTPKEVISIEESNGFYYSKTSDGNTLYNAGYNYQLYYNNNPGKLGSLQIMRFEYDFDISDQKLYQIEYVFKEQNAFNYLLSALSNKYGEPNPTAMNSTDIFIEIGADMHLSHSRWELPNGEEMIVVIDLWDNEYDVCFLTYQTFKKQEYMEEEDSLDFGL